MSALSSLPEQLQPLLKKAEGGIAGALGDIEDALEEMEDAIQTSRDADRVIISVKTRRERGDDEWKDIVAMAPFASEETLDRLVRDLDTAADCKKIVSLAPFLSGETVDRMVKKAVEESEMDIDWNFLAKIAPFCDSLDDVLANCQKQFTLKELLPLAPFLEEETIDRLIRERTRE